MYSITSYFNLHMRKIHSFYQASWFIFKLLLSLKRKSRSVSSWKVIMTRQGQGMGSKGSIKEAEYFLFINLYWSLIWFKLSTTRQGRQFYVEINNTGCQLTDWCSCNTTNQAAICLFSERTVVVRWDQAKLVTSYHFRLETHKVLFKKKIISKRLNWQIISEELRHSRIVIACPISFCQLVKEGNH